MTTTEKNKIIAEFMGYIKNTPSKDFFQHPTEKNRYDRIEFLSYDSDWNWLMEVVEKIEMLGFVFSIKKNWAKITKDKFAIVVRWEEDKNKIEAVYNASLEFIKWYK